VKDHSGQAQRRGATSAISAGPGHTVVIVGAGFSGTALAINLLRRAQQALRVVLIDRAQIARGVAYARRRYPYLLNVPAGRMSANCADAGEFLHFAQRRLPHARATDFLPRELYGEYLESTLAAAEFGAGADVQLERLYGTAIALERPPRSARLQLHLADGRRLSADTLVLALGNPAPAPLPGAAEVHGSPRFTADPWATLPQVRAGEEVLLIGSGLTAVDVALAASAACGGRVRFHALSRRGLLPTQQTHSPPLLDERDVVPLMRAAATSTRRLWTAVRALAQDLERRGGDWREAITLARSHAPQLWQRLGPAERRRFLRHAHSYWDTHRHRLPESSWAELHGLRRAGHFRLHAGRLLQLERVGNQIRATFRPRGANTPTSLLVDRVINCTGPDYDARRTRERLLRSLMAQGMACADPLGLGLATDAGGALLDRSGRPAANLFYLGPMLRAAHWESTAVAELREYAAQLAEQVLERAPRTQRHMSVPLGEAAHAAW
jgi:uncharacterized NAD(P)/FAD-binding protein YdhS